MQWTGNAGVFLQAGKWKILIDGLYESNAFFNSRPSVVSETAAIGKGALFRHADVVAFTHRHEDHFSASCVGNYVRHNRVGKVYIPDGRKLFLPYEDRRRVACMPAVCRLPENGSFFYDKFSDREGIAFFKTPHMGGEMLDVVHYSIIVVCGGWGYVFMGDTDWSYPVDKLKKIMGPIRVKAVFINPLAYADRRRRGWLEKLGRPPVVLYHIPRRGDDISGLRKMTLGNMALSDIKREYVLQEIGQRICL